jgi:hypothetical protein
MADFTLYAENDFAKYLTGVKDISSTTGAVTDTPSTATIACFFATGQDPDDTPADPTLSMNAVWVSGNKWLIFFDRTALTFTLLESKFASTPPYLIVDYPGGFREAFTGEYVSIRPGEVG